MISSSETGAVVRVARRAYWHSFFYLSYCSSSSYSVETETFSVLKTRGALLRNVFFICYLMMWWDLCLTRLTHAKRTIIYKTWIVLRHRQRHAHAQDGQALAMYSTESYVDVVPDRIDFRRPQCHRRTPSYFHFSVTRMYKVQQYNFFRQRSKRLMVHQFSLTIPTPSSVACSESG